MANEKELNPSPKFPQGEYPELSPNPNIHNGIVNKTDEQPNTQVVNAGRKQTLPDYVTREDAIKIAKEYGGDKSKPSFEVTNIKALTDAQCDALEVGNSVDKKTGNQHHIYVVTYKEKNQGLCLTYFDATIIETVSYDYVGGHWVYNSTDYSGGKVFTNVVVNNWVSDDTYTDYPYKAEITCDGITSQSVVEVIFALNQALSGNYAPVCLSGSNKVTIYGKVNTAITIPTIKEVL